MHLDATARPDGWGPELADELRFGMRGGISVYTAAAAFYVACLKAGHIDEAQEFSDWFLETFDIDLET